MHRRAQLAVGLKSVFFERTVMAIQLDHLMIPTKDRLASAKLLGTILGVPWAEQSAFGPFSPVFVNDGLTIDFDEWPEPIPKQHYCFRVDLKEFESILKRLKKLSIAFRSTPSGQANNLVNEAFGGHLVYWGEPNGHVWEMLTVSYARQALASNKSSAPLTPTL